MARGFRWWHKKRGARRTGSKLLGSLGEAIFFATLLVFGTVSLTALVVSQFVSPVEEEVSDEVPTDGTATSDQDSDSTKNSTKDASDDSNHNSSSDANPDPQRVPKRDLAEGDDGSRDSQMAETTAGPGISPGANRSTDHAGGNAATAAAQEGRRLLRVVASYRTGFGFWLMTLVLLSFIIMGGTGLFYTLLHLGASAERRAALAKRAADMDLISEAIPTDKAFPTLPSDADLNNSPGIRQTYRLPTSESPAWQLIAATLFGLLWNSLAVGLFVVAVKSHLSRQPDWLLSLLVVPFAAVGVWSIRYLLRQLTWVTAVGPSIVEISDHPLRPGTRALVFFSQTGHRPLKRLRVDLVCEEEANYHQGTDIRTEICVVFRREILQRDDLGLASGAAVECEAELQVPDEAMHSFQSVHNRVRWKLEVRAEVDGLPAYERSFPVIVYPARVLVERPQLARTGSDDAPRAVRA